MDINKVNQALTKFGDLLSEKPVWMLLIRRNGEVITQIGKYEHLVHSETILKEGTIASWIKSHSEHEIEMLDQLDHGNLQYTITVGTQGVFVILHLHGGFLIGISYHNIGIVSLDALADSIIMHFTKIIDALYDL